jgi:hypothetical protein
MAKLRCRLHLPHNMICSCVIRYGSIAPFLSMPPRSLIETHHRRGGPAALREWDALTRFLRKSAIGS